MTEGSCIDYCGLTDIMLKNRYPLPLISFSFNLLQGAKVFTKLDLHNNHYLVRISEEDLWKYYCTHCSRPFL